MFLLDSSIADESKGFMSLQVEHMGPDYDRDALDSVTKLGLPIAAGHAPNLRSFHLDPETRFTDVVTQGYVPTPGMLVSERFKSLLDGFSLSPHRTWLADVVLGSEHRAYYWLSFIERLEERIDWQASEVVIRRDHGIIEPVRIESAEAMLATARHLVDTLTGRLQARRLAFKAEEPVPDLFMLVLSLRSVFVSDALAQRLQERAMTGFKLEALLS